MKFKLLAICSLCILFTSAQEVITPLRYNPTLKMQGDILNFRITTILDTLNLPFVDDFSSTMVVPDQQKWTDRRVFVNRDFPVNPPSIGVATFDGLDELGNPYDISSPNNYGISDFLSSQAINLSGNSASDSLYFSFFYQPEGLGEMPDPADSLVLQFLDNSGNWVRQWSTPGMTNRPFQQVLISVTNPIFFHGGFRFRFFNYSSLTGNLDHWHLDYVYLNIGRTQSDSLLNDVAHASNPVQFLKRYREMPWDQYLVVGNAQIVDEHSVVARNLGPARNTQYRYELRDLQNNNLLFGTQALNFNFNSLTENSFSYPIFTLPTTPADSATFEVRYLLTANPDIARSNDTLRHIQRFRNYFAYDDGTAEYGYGLNLPTANLALKFVLNQPDSIRAVQMFFTQIATNTANELFALRIWNSLTEPGTSNPTNLIYEKTFLRPTSQDSINQFQTIFLDSAIAVSDTFYVGWAQGSANLLNIGLDRNTPANRNLFFNVTGSWQRSNIQGAVMIRPLMKAPLFQVSNPVLTREIKFSMYPNPASGVVRLVFDSEVEFTYSILDLQGRLMAQETVVGNQKELNVSNLANGLYLVQVSNTSGFRTTQKLIVRN